MLDIDLLRHTPGYGTGALLGAVYFIGFSGVWLVFALYLQSGLGFTPLESGLTVTPFALGAAVSAVIGGRLVERWGRRLTVTGLTMVVVGVGAATVVVAVAPATSVGGWLVPALLVGGVGGGWVIAPNTTMALRCVPVAMAGAAGGALQTGQRIGGAIGTAALPGIFYAVLAATGRAYPTAAAVALGGAVASLAAALIVAVVERRAEHTRARHGHTIGPAHHSG